MAVVSGGTTLIDNGTLDAAVPSGKMTLLATQTASASATISFTSGIDSTYDSYVFKFINIHPSTDNAKFQFNMSTDSGSNYNVTKTTTTIRAIHDEANSETVLQYDPGQDLAQSTAFQGVLRFIGNGNDESGSGSLTIYNPSSSVFVKHFIANGNTYYGGDYSFNDFTAGYGNTVSVVNAIRFQMSAGNIDSGVIKLYGIGG
jgi:hypothetical protein